jgi:hypothetical protein
MATKIGDKSGFLLTDFSMHELGIPRNFTRDYSDIQKNQTAPLKRFDHQYNGIYFAPLFQGDGKFVHDKRLVIIVSADIVHTTKNWHYNYEDAYGIIKHNLTTSDPNKIYETNTGPELVLHDSLWSGNFACILSKRQIPGIETVKELPKQITPQKWLLAPNMPIETDLVERHKRLMKALKKRK